MVGERQQTMALHAALAVAALAALAARMPPTCGAPKGGEGEALSPRPAYPWEASYGFWRHAEEVPVTDWVARTPRPVPRLFNVSTWGAMDEGAKTELFRACLVNQAKVFGAGVLRYRSPPLAEVSDAVRDGGP